MEEVNGLAIDVIFAGVDTVSYFFFCSLLSKPHLKV